MNLSEQPLYSNSCAQYGLMETQINWEVSWGRGVVALCGPEGLIPGLLTKERGLDQKQVRRPGPRPGFVTTSSSGLEKSLSLSGVQAPLL